MWAPHHLAIQSLSGLAEPGHAAVALILGGAVGPLRAVPTQKLVAVAPVSHGTALLQIQVSGVPRLPEAVPDGTGHLLRPAGQSHARQANGGPVRDPFGGLLGGKKCSHTAASFCEIVL